MVATILLHLLFLYLLLGEPLIGLGFFRRFERRVTAAAIVFGPSHAYQGVLGMASTAVLGGLLSATCVLTGSLAYPVILHFLIDARILALPRAAPMPAE